MPLNLKHFVTWFSVRLIRHKTKAMGALIVALIAVIWACLQLAAEGPFAMKSLLDSAHEGIAHHPLILLVALAILPGIGFPISPLLILFGTTLSPQYGVILTCLLGICMQSLCTTWSYLLAAGPLKGWLNKKLQQHYTLPDLRTKSAITVTLLIRITPGFPYALQNLTLGLAGVPIKPYLLLSIPITALISCIFIVSGAALIQAEKTLLLIGFIGLAIIVIGLRFGAKKIKSNVK